MFIWLGLALEFNLSLMVNEGQGLKEKRFLFAMGSFSVFFTFSQDLLWDFFFYIFLGGLAKPILFCFERPIPV